MFPRTTAAALAAALIFTFAGPAGALAPDRQISSSWICVVFKVC